MDGGGLEKKMKSTGNDDSAQQDFLQFQNFMHFETFTQDVSTSENLGRYDTSIQNVGATDARLNKAARLNYWEVSLENWPSQSVREPGEIRSDGRLLVWCTQTQLTEKEQRKLVSRWCDVLPSLQGVRHLWFVSRVSQKLFDAACRVPGLESLRIKWSGVKTLEAIENASALRHLFIGSSAGVQSIQPLGSLTMLQTLGIENFARIRNLDPLADLKELRQLSVEGGMWTTQHVETLAPVGELLNLRYLGIRGLRSADRTLSPLFNLRQLEVLWASRGWDDHEIAELERRNPKLSVL